MQVRPCHVSGYRSRQVDTIGSSPGDGRRLQVIQQLGNKWGVAIDDKAGKRVWVELQEALCGSRPTARRSVSLWTVRPVAFELVARTKSGRSFEVPSPRNTCGPGSSVGQHRDSGKIVLLGRTLAGVAVRGSPMCMPSLSMVTWRIAWSWAEPRVWRTAMARWTSPVASR
jgi:hypothetical protein